MPYSDATREYCAWVSPRGATARSTATRHFIDSRQTRKPGVAPSDTVLMTNTVHGYYVHGYYFWNGAPMAEERPRGTDRRLTD